MTPRLRLLLVSCLLVAATVPGARAADPFLRRTAAVQVVERVGPAVVNVTTQVEVQQRSPFSGFGGNPFFDRFFRDFFAPGRPREAQSLGSGVLIDRRRHVLTNAHVVARASRIRVTLADGREFDATLVGADPNNDLAVLEVETDEKLPWVAPGRSDDILVGEPVIAIGNPFGLSNTVTTGVISAVDRSVRTEDRAFYGFLQTDASINPGNSGGPLLNAEGRLIGINTAIYQGAEGIGFAVPIDVAKRVVEELIEHGAVKPVWLGLELQDLDAQLDAVIDQPRGTRGALVVRVERRGPGDQAGVQRGDLVTRLGRSAVRTARDYYAMLERATPGQDLELELWRDGETRRVSARASQIDDDGIDELADRLLGLSLEAGERGGYRVDAVRPRSGAEQIGFQRGDVVLRINGRALVDEEAYRRSVLGLRGRSRALLVVQRGPGRYHVTVPLS
ncbi:MAG: trypsin-like peptidase domain-containing protein [Myxococcota bacterium]|nr:trypsin-like peptidase domain-containing protein [Myxococcota bacterium]